MTILIVVVYFALLVLIGWIAHRRVRNSTDQYFVAGRNLGTFVNSWAFVASLTSGSTMLAIVGTGLVLGFPYMAALTSAAAIGLVMASILVAKPLRTLGKYTVPDYFRSRYRSSVMRWAVPLIILVASMAYLVAQLKGASLIVADLLGWDYEAGLWAIGLVFLLYVSIGGFLSVTWNDVLQGILMLGMTIAMAVVAIVALKGFGTAFTESTVDYPALGTVSESLPVASYIGAFVTWSTAVCVLPHVIMRVFSSKNIRSARLALGGATVLYVTMALLLTLVGIPAAAQLLTDLDLSEPDKIMLLLADTVFGPLGSGLFAAALLAAIMSSTAGLLMACNAAVGHDIYSRIVRRDASERQVIRVTFAATWIVGLVCIVLAMDPPEFIIVLSTAAVGFLASAFFAPLLLGIWWSRTTSAGATWGMATGAVLFSAAFVFLDLPTSSEILVGVPASFAVTMLLSVMGKRDPARAADQPAARRPVPD